jgi:hypothetical protein
MARLQDHLTTLPKALYQHGVSHVLRHGTRYLRGRLPAELWLRARVCADPESEADSRFELFDPPALTVEYEGTNTLPPQLDYYTRRITPVPGTVYQFEDVAVVGSTPIVGVNERYEEDRYFSASWFGVTKSFFTRELTEIKRSLPLSINLRRRLGNRSPAEELDAGFLLLSEWGSGFYHWFYETLPKLWWREELKQATGRAPPIICHSPLKPYQRRSLELLGYGPETVIEHPERYSRVDDLYIVPHPLRQRGRQTHALPVQLQWVGERISDSVQVDAEFGERIYISRRDANRRQVRNEAELLQQLATLGFEPYEPGRLSLEEQVQLFSNAEVIIGPHGKGFTNLLYAGESTLLELFPKRGADETYFLAAAELDITYDFVECPTPSSTANIPARDKDLIVPVAEVVETIHRHL